MPVGCDIRKILRSVPVIAALLVAMSSLFDRNALAQNKYFQTHAAMGTEYTIELYAKDVIAADHAMQEAFDEIDRVDDLLSNYKPASELSRINREATVGPVTTDPETFEFLQRSMDWSRASDGAFDITVGPLLRLWGFFFHNGHVPDETSLAAQREVIGWQHVRLDAATRSIAFADHRAMELDPGSIGKGFAVDRVVRLLRQQGAIAALISAGGSTVYALGAPPGASGWPVIVRDPRNGGKLETLLLKDTSLSTGACTEKYFIQDEHRYCHIFNPKTGRPMEDVLQSSVIDPSATDSDALSTVAFVIEPEAAKKLLAGRTQTQVLVFRARVSGAKDDCMSLHWQGVGCGAAGANAEEKISR
jgi:thiamine biosynthesis lipoprotein